MVQTSYTFYSIRTNKRRFILAVFSVIICMMLTIALGLVTLASNVYLQKLLVKDFDYDFTIISAKQTELLPSFKSEPVVNNISTVKELTGIYRLLIRAAIIYNDTGFPYPVIIFGEDRNYTRGTMNSLSGSYKLGENETVISKKASERLKLNLTQSIELNYYANSTSAKKNLTINGIVDFQGRFPPKLDVYIILPLEVLQNMFFEPGYVSMLIATVPDNYYDLGNVVSPAGNVRKIGTEIALLLGEDYQILAPKVYIIESSVQSTGYYTAFVYLFSIVIPAIIGILLSSILNLSVEEKNYELAMMRLLGARKTFISKIVLMELAMVLLISLPVGITLGLYIPSKIFYDMVSNLSGIQIISMVIQQSIIAIMIFILFSTGALNRAFRAHPLDAVKRIKTPGIFKFISSEKVDRRVFVSALVIFITLIYATLAIPYLFVFMPMEYVLLYILISIIIMLIALSVSSLGVIPTFEVLIIRLFAFSTKKVNVLSRKNVIRYARRNLSTNVIFTVVVSILLFFSTFMNVIDISVEDTVRYSNGADIRVDTQFPFYYSNIKNLNAISNIESYSLVPTFYGATLSTPVDIPGYRVNLIGLDENFTKVNYVSLKDIYAGTIDSFMFNDNYSIILSRELVDVLKVNIYDKVALTIGDKRIFLNVSTVLRSLPGFAVEVQETRTFGSAGAFISINLVSELLNIDFSQLRFKTIFIKVKPGTNILDVASTIEDMFAISGTASVQITNDEINEAKQQLSFFQLLLLGMFSILILIAIFSLVVSLYATILEREFEFGILKALGLRVRDVIVSLLLEGFAIGFASVVTGILVGVFIAFVFIYWLNIFSPFDLQFGIPLTTVLYIITITFVLSLVSGYIISRRSARIPTINLLRKIES